MLRASYVLTAIITSVGLCAAGYFVGDGIRHMRSIERSVNVRGLVEREVQADTAQLTLTIQHTGADTAAIFPKMEETQKQTIEFLKQFGVKDDEIEAGQWSSMRASTEDLKNDPTMPHFTVSGSLTVNTHNIDAVQAAYKKINDLRIKTGGGVTYADVDYTYTGIGAIRAEMIAAATKDARNQALQFAQDSGSKVGSIRHASQGQFEILAPASINDERRSVRKTVRVVTTVDYELKD